MKIKILTLFFLTLVSCSSKPSEDIAIGAKDKETKGKTTALPGARVGFSAPNFSLKSTDQKNISLSNFKDKAVLLDFWATWCPPCRFSTPALVRINKKFKDQGLAVIGISLDEEPEPVPPFLKKEKVEHLILYAGNSSVAQDYQVRAIPSFFLIDKNGMIKKRYDGFYPDLEKEWEKEIPILLNK
ncbi:MAG: TlpA family protein disulfide reductase [Elusimicrobia bacterium]|nr:TlpA family protein disulfide reductase [Elusimicrobiota bacterium]